MILTLARRHVGVFLRDRMAVFFSLLSPLILFLIYIFFLGTLQKNSLTSSFKGASDSAAQNFVNSWLFAGVLTITTLSTALVALGVFVEDRATSRFKDFLIAPITRRQLTLGYLTAAFVVSFGMSIVVALFSQVFLKLAGGETLSPGAALETLGGIALLSLTFSSIMSWAVAFISSGSAFSAFNTIVGTVVGFLAGAYINVATLPRGVVNVINFLPFAQGAALIRKPFTDSAITALTGGSGEARRKLSDDYGVNLVIGGHDVSASIIVVILLSLVVIFFALGVWRMGRKIG